MIESILINWDNINIILSEREEEIRCASIDKNLLTELRDFLEPFYEASTDFQKRSEPSLHFVKIWRDDLVTHLEIKPDDRDALKELKAVGMSYLQEKWVLHPIHNLAVFLHPQIKGRRFTPKEKLKVISMIREESFKIQVAESSANQPVSSNKRSLEITTSEGER